jgi:hypothetical protein
MFQLPNGETTKSKSKYVKEWRALAAPLVGLLDAKLTGWDPVLYLEVGTFKWEVPPMIAFKLNEAIERGEINATAQVAS